jgi:opacity protein-like surface antigen
MLKKIIIASSILAVTSGIAAANPAPYVGASVGINTNTSSSAAYGKNSSGFTLSAPANYRGVPFSACVGYGGVISDAYYLAGEVEGTVATADISNNNGLKTSYGYGASVIPGLMLSDHTLAFARAGVERTHFTNANTTQTGGKFGLGLQTTVTQNIDVRGEYDFTAYRSLNNSIGRVASPRSDAFNVGLIYKFD